MCFVIVLYYDYQNYFEVLFLRRTRRYFLLIVCSSDLATIVIARAFYLSNWYKIWCSIFQLQNQKLHWTCTACLAESSNLVTVCLWMASAHFQLNWSLSKISHCLIQSGWPADYQHFFSANSIYVASFFHVKLFHSQQMI